MVQYIEQSTPHVPALRRVIIASLSAAAVLMILDLCSLRRPWRRGEVNNADKLSLIITISNLALLFMCIPLCFSCWHPVIVWTVFGEFFIFSRGINVLFFVYRAKSVQGPNPVLSQKWFTKYIPFVVCTYYGIGFIAVGFTINPNWIICVSNEFSYQSGAVLSVLMWLHFAVELSISAVVTFLFVVPLWRVYRAGSNANHEQQQRSMRVLKDALKYAVVLTAINLLSSNNLTLGFQCFGDDHPAVWKFMGAFDPVINIVTTIMLFKRNRVLLWKIFCRIRYVMGHMCCLAVVIEMDGQGQVVDLRQAQLTAMAIMAVRDSPKLVNLQIPTDSITEFTDVMNGKAPDYSLDLAPCS